MTIRLVGETQAGAQAKVDALEKFVGTTLGDTSYDGAAVTLDFDTNWGIDGLGNPYYDPDGVAGSEAAVLVVNPDGSIAVKKPTTVITSDWDDSPADVQTNLDTHEARTDNPHGVTAAQVGASETSHDHDSVYVPKADFFVVRRSTDSAGRTNSTLAVDDVLKWAALANQVWFCEAYLRVNAANTAMDANFGWAGPSGSSGSWGVEGIGSNNLGGGWGPATTAGTPTALLDLTGTRTIGTFAGTMGIILAGTFITGATAGDFTLRWAQSTTDAGELKLMANSFLRLTRLA